MPVAFVIAFRSFFWGKLDFHTHSVPILCMFTTTGDGMEALVAPVAIEQEDRPL